MVIYESLPSELHQKQSQFAGLLAVQAGAAPLFWPKRDGWWRGYKGCCFTFSTCNPCGVLRGTLGLASSE